MEYFDEIADKYRVVTRLSRGSAKYAEILAIKAIQRRIGKAATKKNISRIYTEYSPCGNQYSNCAAFIQKTAPNAKVGWLDEFNYPGRMNHRQTMRKIWDAAVSE